MDAIENKPYQEKKTTKVIALCLLFLLLNFFLIQFQSYFHVENLLIPIVFFLVFLSVVYTACGRNYTFLVIAIVAIDVFISSLIVDFSSDGNSYHDLAISTLSEGKVLFSSHLDTRIAGTPLFQWIFPAIFRFAEFGAHITSGGKLIGGFLLYFLACSIPTKKTVIRFSNVKVDVVAGLIAFPAIFWGQLFNGYGDYWTYWALALLATSSIALFRLNFTWISRRYFDILCLGFALAATVKYQSAILGVYFGFVLLGLLLLNRKFDLFIHLFYRRLKVVSCVSLIALAILLITFVKNYDRSYRSDFTEFG